MGERDIVRADIKDLLFGGMDEARQAFDLVKQLELTNRQVAGQAIDDLVNDFGDLLPRAGRQAGLRRLRKGAGHAIAAHDRPRAGDLRQGVESAGAMAGILLNSWSLEL